MTDIRPTDLPELRAEAMLSQNTGGYALQRWLRLAERKGFSSDMTRTLWKHEIERLAVAELFYVSPDMCRLARAAAGSLPSFKIQPADLPTDCGLIVFDTDADDDDHEGADAAPLRRSLTRALVWARHDSGVLVSGYMDRRLLAEKAHADERPNRAANLTDEPRLVLVPDLSFNMLFGDRGWDELPSESTIADQLPMLLATWLLMQQPLARMSEVEPDRAAKKRLRRAGHEPRPVRVIELRRPKSSGEAGDGESNYQHQWIVRGHWRNHWHPKREVHRPVWIAPHVKGPEGAPMIGGDKVYAWKR